MNTFWWNALTNVIKVIMLMKCTDKMHTDMTCTHSQQGNEYTVADYKRWIYANICKQYRHAWGSTTAGVYMHISWK